MIPKRFKPMLASPLVKMHEVKYPVFVSPKLDGVRAIVFGGVVYSRNLKRIPNVHVQTMFGHLKYEGYDGELIVGSPTAPDVFTKTMSGVMSIEGNPDVEFHVFDRCQPTLDYLTRRPDCADHSVVIVPQNRVDNQVQLDHAEQAYVNSGYEGCMVRSIRGHYKHGRSTEREGLLLKLKRFDDAEAEIVGVEELMRNGNEKDASGKRTSHKAGKTGKSMLGALIVKGINGTFKGVQFNIGTGFTEQQRIDMWHKPLCWSNIVKYKYFASGAKDAPRFPVFLGFRDRLDLPQQ